MHDRDGLPEPARLAELLALDVLDTPAETAFDDIARAAASVAGTPAALVTLLDDHRQWVKARVGLDVAETSRDLAFCDHPVRTGRELVVEDATRDPRFADNPFVTGEPGIRRYAGYPLRTASGAVLGTLCVVGYAPGRPTPDQEVVLRVLADQVVTRLELRRRLAADSAQAQQERARLTAAHEAALAHTAFTAGLLESIDVGVVACDADGRLTLVNAAARGWHGRHARHAGTTSDDWQAEFDLFEADGTTPLPPERVPLRRALDEGTVAGALLTIVRPGGPARLVRCDGRRLDDGGAVVVVQDVTAVHRAAREVAEARDAARAVVDTAADAFISLDGDGTVVDWNPQAEAVFGWSRAEALGRDLGDLIVPPEHAARHRAGVQRSRDTALGERLGQVLQLPARRRDGREVPVELRLWGSETADGWRFHAFLRDISDRVAADAALAAERAAREAATRASEERFRAAFEHGPMAMGRLDGEAVLTEANPAMRRLLARPSRRLLGLPLRDFVVGRDAARLEAALARADDGTAELVEVRLLRADDSEIWCEVAATRVSAPEGSYLLVQLADVTARKHQEQVLEEAARRDVLTGLLNREALSVLLAERLQEEGELALLFVDLDDFKAVNDTGGHDAGDAVLVEVARRVADAVRPGDAVVRFGGDEFVVVCAGLQSTAQSAGDALAARLADVVAAPVAHRGREYRVGASVGVAVCRPGEEAAAVLARADALMYERKAHRRQRSGPRPDYRPRLVDLVATAVEEGRAEVHYQPVVDLRSGLAVGAEALLRLRDRDGAPVPPDVAVPVAEAHGHIAALGAWVLEEAVRRTVAWKRLLPPGAEFGLGVNLSPAQLDGRLPDRVRDVLDRHGLPADALVLELTETRLTEDTTAVARVLGAVRDVGVQLAVDDFGTGYASLGYLTSFPVNVLKLDRSFTALLGSPGRGGQVARGLTRLATSTDLVTVVEGIETVEQRDAVAAEGCRLGQGWLWGRAVPAAEFTARLQRQLPGQRRAGARTP